MYSEYTELQKRVIGQAKEMVRHQPWYRGICVDSLPGDSVIAAQGIEDCAKRLANETAFLDGPHP